MFLINNYFAIWLNTPLSQYLLSFRYKFDDERVTKEDVKRALEEQYGGEEEVFPRLKIACLVISF